MSEGAILKPVYDMGQDRFLCPTKKNGDRTYSALIDGDGNRKGSFLFRKSGLGSKFKGEYAIVIMYCEVEEKEEWVVINKIGHVCFMQNGLNHIYLQGGHIVFATNEGYYNLKTGERIVNNGSSSMNTEEFIFVNNEFGFGNDDALGVHKINKHTLEVEVFPKEMSKNN